MITARLPRVVIGIAAIAAALISPTVAQAATPAASDFFPIKNIATGECVQPQFDVESVLVSMPCTNTPAQRWVFDRNSNGNHIINQLTGFCIYMNGPVTSGSPVTQTSCSTVTNNDWKVTPPPTVTTIMSRASGRDTQLCITPDPPGISEILRILPCNGALNQFWLIGL